MGRVERQRHPCDIRSFKQLLGACAVVCAAMGCAHCPTDTYQQLSKKIPPQADKNQGFDLKGWTFSHVRSAQSGQVHYFYTYPAHFDPQKPTMLLLHGLFLDGRTFLHMRPLARQYNLIAYDLPYQSTFYTGNKHDFSKLLLDFLQTQQLSHIQLAGVSLGGMIALNFIQDTHQVAVERLILIASNTAKTQRELRSENRLGRFMVRLTDMQEDKIVCIVGRSSMRRKRRAERWAKRHDAELEGSIYEILSIKQPSFYRQVIAALSSNHQMIQLDQVTCPTLIIHGVDDDTIPLKKARGLLQRIPHATFIEVAGGHDIAYTKGEQLSELIMAHAHSTSRLTGP